MKQIKSVAVYLGSRPGKKEQYVKDAWRLGQLLAENGIRIVYGGASVGTMKALADGAASVSGEIIGVFPEGFKGNKDNAAAGIHVGPEGVRLSKTIFVKDLPERIATMESLSDAMIFLPGSVGTMVEVFNWTQSWPLGYHSKPAFVLNTDNYYKGLLIQIETMISEGFIDAKDLEPLTVAADLEDLMSKLIPKE